MPRSRGSDLPQRQSPRGPSQLRSSSSDSDPLPHHRSITDRNPKAGDHRRSPRGVGGTTTPQSETVNQKKLGTRIGDLETQLGQAQEELKILKGQLASAETAKKEAQQELHKKAQKRNVSNPIKNPTVQCQEPEKLDSNIAPSEEIPDENQPETDVFEVPMDDPKVEINQPADQDQDKDEGKTDIELPEPEKPSFEDLALKNDEISSLKAKLEEKEKEEEAFTRENESLKTQLNAANLEISNARSKEEEMSSRLSQLGKEMEESKTSNAQLSEKLEAVGGEKEALEAEMRKLRVQTEQWRKAADAAAAVLAGGAGMEMMNNNGGRRISERRCGSMDKHVANMFEAPVGGYGGYVGSPGFVDDSDDGGKRRGSGIRMFGDLWKKKNQK